MGVLSSLLRNLGVNAAAKRSWTPYEAREFISKGQVAEAAKAVAALSSQTPQFELVSLCLKGEIAFRERRDAEAETLFREALRLAPGHCDAHYGLSLVMLDRGESEPALRHAQFAVNNGTDARLSAQLGLCELSLRNFTRAEQSLLRATRLDPNDKASFNNLGIALRARGDIKRAKRMFDRAVRIDPRFGQALANLKLLEEDAIALGVSLVSPPPIVPDGVATSPEMQEVRRLRDDGQMEEAIDRCEALCTQLPDSADVVIELFALYREQGDAQTGLDALEAFRTRHPGDIDCIAALGKALLQHDEYKTAKPLIEEALAARPEDVSLLMAMADIRGEQDRHVDAGELLEKACALSPTINVRGQLATNLVRRCKYDEALELADELFADKAAGGDALLSIRVYALTYLGRYEEAMPLIDAAIAKNPNDPNCRWPRSCMRLLHEDFAAGWDDYAYRNLNSTTHLRMVPFPMWRGEALEGKTILVLAEQGLGDQVMFASCLQDLLALNPSRMVVEVVNRVAPTVARSFPRCEIVATRQDDAFAWVKDIGQVDYFVMMGDLPRRFRRSRVDFPLHQGYLNADPPRVQAWRDTFAAMGPKPKIGVSWRGGTEATRKAVRTMDVLQLMELTTGVDADWICLQYGDVKADLAKAEAAGHTLNYWAGAIKDLDEFAAIISALDLVITVCNTTVHYAGALGVPVWVLAPRIPEWRYGLHSTAMPWYPSSRVYRQVVDGDWETLIGNVGNELAQRTWSA